MSGDKYAQAKTDRQKYVEAVLSSGARKKIVVAGPGTGKTYLFKQILKTTKNSVTLTFVNSLVDDLSLELCGLSDVKTLHGFGRGIMAKAVGSARIFPRLPAIIRKDANYLLGEDVDFESLFQNMSDENDLIRFYYGRMSFYRYHGFNDIIYRAVKYLDANPHLIPVFDQVVVDEFQDFNVLEVSLIELLALKSAILIVGDDDQSLYYFKHASPTHIRERHGDAAQYEAFTLPYCSRCTRVIVDSINDVIRAAINLGFLTGRIDKPYLYFEDEKKEQECERYPKLVHVHCFSGQVAYYIERAIYEIAQERREKFSVLVIAPTKSRCRGIARSLRAKGFENIPNADDDTGPAPTILDALSLLGADSKCNLGWRVAAELFMPQDEFERLIHASRNTEKDIIEHLPSELTKRVKKALVSSIGRRNGLCELSGRCHEAKSFSWTGVKLERDGV